jgi:hypothetical protein
MDKPKLASPATNRLHDNKTAISVRFDAQNGADICLAPHTKPNFSNRYSSTTTAGIDNPQREDVDNHPKNNLSLG